MAALISNGSELYRHEGMLLRSPIAVELHPVEMAYYAIAEEYNNLGPYGGYWASSSTSSVDYAAERMRDDYRSPGRYQMWRQVTTQHEPENIFYQGRWATSMNYDQGRGEAYMQLAGYRFELPVSSMNIVGAQLKVIHGGTIIAYQNPEYTSASKNNFYAADWSSPSSRYRNWRDCLQGTMWEGPTWTHKVGIFSGLGNYPTSMYEGAQDTIDLNTGLMIGGTPTGNVRIWTSGSFGYIPTASWPYSQLYRLSDAFIRDLKRGGGGWVVALPFVNADEPNYSEDNLYYWLCESHWGYRLVIEYE